MRPLSVRFPLFLVLALALGVPCGARADTIVPAGTISASTTWSLSGSPYIVQGIVFVQGTSTPVLTVAAGVTVKFNSGAALYIGQGAAGGLMVSGSQSSPVTFTANNSTSPGFWQGIQLLANATATSSVTWATVQYGGSSGSSWGGVKLAGPSVTLTHVTASNNAFAGFSVHSGSPNLVTCTASANPWGVYVLGGTPTVKTSSQIVSNMQGGVYVANSASPSLQTVTISNNTGYAISQDNRVTLGTVSALTVSGNTNNAVELKSISDITANATWKNVGLTYVASGGVAVEGSGSPFLTIQSGVTVKFAQGTALVIGTQSQPGGLQAIGTSASPIVFTANTANPSPGYWVGLQFQDKALSSSAISYATISYASTGTYVQNSILQTGSPVWPSLQNVTFQSNSTGLSAFKSTPKIINCNFVTNGAGLNNSTPSVNSVTAGLNYWGSASGPSGSGPGTGQSVSTGVVYEPWLLSAPTNPNYLNTFTLKNRTFNPVILVNSTISSGSAQSAAWTTTIFNGGSAIRTYSGTGTTWQVIWDGKDGSGVSQPDGTYSYQLQTGTAAIAKGFVIKDSTRLLTVTGYTAQPAYFSPNADGVQDTSTLSGTFSFDDVSWTLRFKNPSNTVVKTVTGTGSAISYVWDGKNGASNFPDAAYTCELTAADGSANVVVSVVSTLDTTLPTATITSPTNGQTLSNVYQNGVSDVAIVGTASDTNVDHWQLDSLGLATIATGTTNITNNTIGTWATLPVANSSYTLKLQVWDKAGNTSNVTVPITVGNFKASETVLEFNASTGGTVTYTSTIPFTLTETLVVKNANNQTIRTLVNGASRNTGTYSDPWDGKNGSAVLQPDGPYFYVATLVAGTHSMTWDLTTTFLNDGTGGFVYTGFGPFDPYNNQPRAITYNFAYTGQVSIGFSTDNQLNSACLPPDYCPLLFRYEESGAHTYYWAGVDASGALRPDLTYGVVVKDRTQFPKNAVVLFGTKPSITAVSVTPVTYSPALGTQTVSYNLATYQNQAVTVTVTFLNEASLSVLRTITLSNVTPGNKTTTWDGKADNGMWVAPGGYLITVSTTDSVGNPGSGQILTNVVY